MPTITGLTADRMQEIIDATIVDADIVADHLILTKEDGSTIDAGVAKGADGAPGPAGTAGIVKGIAFPPAPADGDVLVRTDLPGSPLFAYSPEAGWEPHPRMGAVTVPSAKVRRSTNGGIANSTSSVIQFDTIEQNTDGMFSLASPTRLTIKTPGVYLVTGNIDWAPTSGVGGRDTWLQVNGNVLDRVSEAMYNVSGTGDSRQSVAGIRRFAAGDFIELGVYQSSGGSLNVNASTNQSQVLSAVWLGGAGQTIDERGVPAFSVNNLANQSIPGGNVATKLAFPSVAYDTENSFDTTNNRFVVKTPGLWNLTLLLPLEDNASQWLVRLYKNGARYRDLNAVDASTALVSSPYITVNTQVLAAAGDYFEIFMFNNPAGAFSVFGAATEYSRAIFSGSLVGTGKVVTPHARASLTADQSIPNNTPTIIALGTETADNDGIHDTVTNNSRLVCRTAGVYSIRGGIGWAASSTGLRRAAITVNGAVVAANGGSAMPAPDASWTESTAIMELAVGDYVELQGYQTSGGALLAFGTLTTHLSMVKVGAPTASPTGIQDIQEGWHMVGTAGEPAFQNATSSYDNVSYRKTKDGSAVQLRGILQYPNAGLNANGLLFTLPVGYRPQTVQEQPIQLNASGAVRSIRINPSGAITTGSENGAWPAGGPCIAYLGGITIPLG